MRSQECSGEKSTLVEREMPFLTQISESFEKLQSNALKDLDRSLGNAKLKELRELALFVESNRNSDKKICIGKNINDNQFTYKKGPCSVTWSVTAVSYSDIFFLLVSN